MYLNDHVLYVHVPTSVKYHILWGRDMWQYVCGVILAHVCSVYDIPLQMFMSYMCSDQERGMSEAAHLEAVI